jgi:hypothetical protein
MYPFDQVNYEYFNVKDLKSVPDSVKPNSYKFERLHTMEVRDAILKDCSESLVRQLASFCAKIAFPEMVFPVQMMLERFKQNTLHRKQAQYVLDLIHRNELEIAAQRSTVKDKSLKDPIKVVEQFHPDVSKLALHREAAKFE